MDTVPIGNLRIRAMILRAKPSFSGGTCVLPFVTSLGAKMSTKCPRKFSGASPGQKLEIRVSKSVRISGCLAASLVRTISDIVRPFHRAFLSEKARDIPAPSVAEVLLPSLKVTQESPMANTLRGTLSGSHPSRTSVPLSKTSIARSKNFQRTTGFFWISGGVPRTFAPREP